MADTIQEKRGDVEAAYIVGYPSEVYGQARRAGSETQSHPHVRVTHLIFDRRYWRARINNSDATP